MKQPAIFSPSGRSTMLATVVTAKTSVISAYAHVIRSRRRRADSVTANAAEVISTRTPVAYAPAWESTSASKTQVTRKATAANTSTSGRAASAHAGAIP